MEKLRNLVAQLQSILYKLGAEQMNKLLKNIFNNDIIVKAFQRGYLRLSFKKCLLMKRNLEF